MSEKDKTTWITHKLYKAEIVDFLRSINADYDPADENLFSGFAEKFIDELRKLIAENESFFFCLRKPIF